ncbi:MAG: hypothetical protein Fur0043_14830 [Anaerolineales bacterium]
MNAFTSLLAVVMGIVLRLALPIGITALAVYFLRKLDARWQAKATQQVPNVEKPACWEVNHCLPEMREACPGYQSVWPCWQAFRGPNGYLQERCLGCNVFKKAPIPTHS